MELRVLQRAIEIIRQETNLKLPVQTISVFLEIATAGDDGISNILLAEKVGISEGSVSRNVDQLTERGRMNELPGFGLVESERDPENRRLLLSRLTPKGRALIRRIEGIGGRAKLKAL
jgi:DNA-binding MarR family transcriptional regulator